MGPMPSPPSPYGQGAFVHVLNGPTQSGHKETTHQRVASVEDLVRPFDPPREMLVLTVKHGMLNYQQQITMCFFASKLAMEDFAS